MTSDKTHKKPLIILTAGGTGGHVYPAESLAAELQRRGYRLALVTDARGKANGKGKLAEIRNFAVQAGALVGKSKLTKIKSLFKTGIGVLQSMAILIRNKPACVVGFGGYAAFPCCFAAILLGIDLVIHEQNAVMSRTNRFLAKHASLIAKSFSKTLKIPPDVKTVMTGMPIRPNIIQLHNQPYPKLGAKDKFKILVMGGSQGAKIFGTTVPEAIESLDPKYQKKIKVFQQCRSDDEKYAKKIYKKLETEVILKPFFDNMPEIYQEIHLIITRSGASSTAEILALGIPSILIPLPIAADNHQYYNALEITDAKGGFLFDQKDFTSNALSALLETLINDYDQLQRLAANTKQAGITDAAERFANAIEKDILHTKHKG